MKLGIVGLPNVGKSTLSFIYSPKTLVFSNFSALIIPRHF